MSYQCVVTLNELKDYLKGVKVIAFDFETSPRDGYRNVEKAALDPHKSTITGISFSKAEGDAIYIPLAHRSGQNAKDQDVILHYLTNAVFQNPQVIKVAHNLAFESSFLYAKNIVIQSPVYDTIAASQLTLKSSMEFRKLSDSGLKTLVPELFDVEMPSFKDVTQGKHFDELDPHNPETISYACADSDYTLRLYHLFNGWFDRYLPKHRFIVEEVESPTSVYVGLMKYNGILMDRDLMVNKQHEAEAHLSKLKADIAFITGDVSVGSNASTLAFKKYLYQDLGLPILKTTAKNKEAADDETLILLEAWCRDNKPELTGLFELIQGYRKWGKLKSTYIDGYLKHISSVTGRIHSDMLPLGTLTGRFSARNPNFQNCPRQDNDPIGVRHFIVAPEGKVLLSLDFSQIELRVGAFYCRDETMLETYHVGGDIHAQTTSVIYRIPFEQARDKNDERYKERRAIAKNCNFGVFYGLFPKGLQRNLKFKAGLNTSLSECEEIVANLKSGYAALSTWQEAVKKKATIRKYTETYLGRRRYLPDITSTDFGKKSFSQRCALNTPIQGTAADILKLTLNRIILGLPDRMWLKPLLQIHDELLFELPKGRLSEAVDFIKDCMEARPFEDFDVPIEAEAAYGVNFGHLKNWEAKD